MGVNLSTFWQFAVVRRLDRKPRLLVDVAVPLLGFVFCALIWWNLNAVAKTVGGLSNNHRNLFPRFSGHGKDCVVNFRFGH